ncbi:hypothetical protein [Vulcanisaeta distributa]|uniref:hypothetical protein n=1 Tax=Vulcanisaeta distributa TaxID=164451 RepID=UPI0006D063F1|nr:hypothetical protein [Vulcanisaeta distributa]
MGLIRDLRVAMASRRLFRNWLVAGLRYFLIMHGLAKGLITVKCSNASYGLSPSTYSFIVNAYYDGFINGFVCRDVIEALINGVLISLIPPDSFAFNYLGKLIYFRDSTGFLFDVVFENFLGGAYDDLNVRDRVVVDVGGGVGDTAILFTLRGSP